LSADLSALERRPEIVASTGVRPVAISSFSRDGLRYGLRLIGADGASTVARPLVVRGSWVAPGRIVLERSFAEFLGLSPGDRLRTPAGDLLVSGIAVVSQGEGYPASQPGIAFALADTIATVVPDRSRWGAHLGLRLAAPEASKAFVASARRPGFELDDWQDDRAVAAEFSHTTRVILSIFAGLLLLAGGAVLATLVSGRVLSQLRQIGVLKAAGMTPAQVTRLVVAEQLGLALLGTVLGVAAGLAATPLFVTRSASLLSASETPPLGVLDVALVAGSMLVCVAAFTAVPTWRNARQSVGTVLAGATPRRRQSRLAAIAERARAPLPVALGARDAFARPGRATLTALSLALSVAAAVATLSMEASLEVGPQPLPAVRAADPALPAFDPVDDDAGERERLRPIVYGLDAVLLFVALTNLLAAILLSLRERARNLGLLKAAGLTPGQTTGVFLTSQAGLAVAAAVAGIPLGLALFRLAIEATGSTDEYAYASPLQLVLLAPVAVALVLALATPLARRAAARSTAGALRYE
jgi:putative ABC transport system permease protein